MSEAGQRPASLEIRAAKLRDYLLNVDHPAGGPKARFFLMQGFSADRLDTLAHALIEHAMTSAWTWEPTRYGVNFVFQGVLTTPSGKTPTIVTVWNEPARDMAASLVTAYPV